MMLENMSELKNYSQDLQELRLFIKTEVSGDSQK